MIELKPHVLTLLRAYKRLSQHELAFYMGVPHSSVSKIESGQFEFSEHYQEATWRAIQRLNITDHELQHIFGLVRGAGHV